VRGSGNGGDLNRIISREKNQARSPIFRTTLTEAAPSVGHVRHIIRTMLDFKGATTSLREQSYIDIALKKNRRGGFISSDTQRSRRRSRAGTPQATEDTRVQHDLTKAKGYLPDRKGGTKGKERTSDEDRHGPLRQPRKGRNNRLAEKQNGRTDHGWRGGSKGTVGGSQLSSMRLKTRHGGDVPGIARG